MPPILLTIGPDLTIVADVSPAAAVGAARTLTFSTRGERGAVRWRLISTTLPGAEWTYSGSATGWTTASTVTFETTEALTPGTYTITMRAVDSARYPVQQTFAFRVIALPLTATGTLAALTVGTPYSDTIDLAGGVGARTIVAATLPAGVSGSISGDVLTVAGTGSSGHGIAAGASGTFAASITVQDADGTQVTWTQLLSLSVPSLVITATSLPDATVGEDYVGLFTISGGVGHGYGVNHFTGLPASLSALFDDIDEIDVTGTPDSGTDAASPYALSIEVEDAEGNIATLSPTLVVDEAAPTLTYSYFNPAEKGANASLSDSDKVLTATGTTNAQSSAVVTKAAGKWRIQFVIENFIDYAAVGFSIAPNQSTTQPFLGYAASSWGLWHDTGALRLYNDGVDATWAGTYSDGVVVDLILDINNGLAWFAVDDVVVSGDPAAGTGAMVTFTPNTMLIVADPYTSGSVIRLRTNPAEMTGTSIAGFTDGWPD